VLTQSGREGETEQLTRAEDGEDSLAVFSGAKCDGHYSHERSSGDG
jgi:hypothetical protein